MKLSLGHQDEMQPGIHTWEERDQHLAQGLEVLKSIMGKDRPAIQTEPENLPLSSGD